MKTTGPRVITVQKSTYSFLWVSVIKYINWKSAAFISLSCFLVMLSDWLANNKLSVNCFLSFTDSKMSVTVSLNSALASLYLEQHSVSVGYMMMNVSLSGLFATDGSPLNWQGGAVLLLVNAVMLLFSFTRLSLLVSCLVDILWHLIASFFILCYLTYRISIVISQVEEMPKDLQNAENRRITVKHKAYQKMLCFTEWKEFSCPWSSSVCEGDFAALLQT